MLKAVQGQDQKKKIQDENKIQKEEDLALEI